MSPAQIPPIDLGLASWIGIVLPAAVLAAVVGAAVNIWLARRKSREEERARVRNTFAEAFRAYADYKEFPYAVRRRDVARPGEERVRLADEMRAVQSRLSYYECWTRLESASAGAAYAVMVQHLRQVAGGSIHDAWTAAGVSEDAEMNIPATVVDLSALGPFEQAYREVVLRHLRWLAPRWSRL